MLSLQEQENLRNTVLATVFGKLVEAGVLEGEEALRRFHELIMAPVAASCPELRKS